MSQECCPLCSGTAHFSFQAGDSFYGVTDYEAEMYRCTSCELLFQWPLPEREKISSFYPNGYWQESTGPKSAFAKLQEIYIELLLKMDLMTWIKRLSLKKGSRFLDIGCSRGDWLALIEKTGLQVKGLEADPRAASYARDTFGLEIDEVDADQWAGEVDTYDGISFFHLLEHLRTPEHFLETCHRSLKPQGQILVRVPNIRSWQWSLFGKAWKGLEIPRHLYLFTPKSLTQLLEKQGFEVTRCATWSLRDGPPAMTSSLFPAGEPTWQQIKGKSSTIATLAYLFLNWVLTPVELLASLLGRGSMITVIARKR